MKRIEKYFKKKKKAIHPYCKYLARAWKSYPSEYDYLEDDNTVVCSFDKTNSLIPYINEKIVLDARKNEENFLELRDYDSQCTELRSFLFLYYIVCAVKLGLNIIIANGYYMETFELIHHIYKIFSIIHH
jgi:hypothetical protein